MTTHFNYAIPLGWNERKQTLRLAQERGLGLEICAFASGPALDDPNLRAEYELRLATLLRGFRHGLSYHGAFMDLALHSGDARIAAITRQRIMEDLGTASRLGCANVVFHTGFNPLVPTRSYAERFFEIHAAFWPRMAAAFPTLKICLENQWEHAPSLLRRLVEDIGHPRVRLCLDVAHANAYSTCPPAEWMEQLAPLIEHLHWSDNLGDRDSHLPIGEGRIDWMDVYRRTTALNRAPTIVLELRRAQAIEKSLRELAAVRFEIALSDCLPGESAHP